VYHYLYLDLFNSVTGTIDCLCTHDECTTSTMERGLARPWPFIACSKRGEIGGERGGGACRSYVVGEGGGGGRK